MNQTLIFLCSFFLLLGTFNQANAQCSQEDIKVPEDLVLVTGAKEPQALQIETRGIKDVRVVIFDRWGKEVFKSSVSVLNPPKDAFKSVDTGWDGTSKGEALKPGMYVYSVEATCSNNKFTRKGGTVILTKKS